MYSTDHEGLSKSIERNDERNSFSVSAEKGVDRVLEAPAETDHVLLRSYD